MRIHLSLVALRVMLGCGAIALASFPSRAPASPLIRTLSTVCTGFSAGNSGDCYDAAQSISRGYTYVETDGSGGINYSAQASSSAVPSQFSLFAHAGGSSDGTDQRFGYARAYAQIFYSDEISTTGASGTGRAVFPWLIDGAVSLSGTSASGPTVGANFGLSFCQIIPVGASTGGFGCRGYTTGNANAVTDVFTTSDPDYSKIWYLDFPITFGVDYVLNSYFGTSVAVNAPGGMVTSDFLHTGTLQPVQFYDSFGDRIYDVGITSALGLDYLNPQAPAPGSGSVPEPATLALLGLGLAGLGFSRRKKA